MDICKEIYPALERRLERIKTEQTNPMALPPAVVIFLPGKEIFWALSHPVRSQDPDWGYGDFDLVYGIADLGMGFPEAGDIYLPEILQGSIKPEVLHPLLLPEKPLAWILAQARVTNSLCQALRQGIAEGVAV